MNNGTYKENKEIALDIIPKVREYNPELGEYLERHFIFDDKNETMVYTGKPEIIASVLSKTTQL